MSLTQDPQNLHLEPAVPPVDLDELRTRVHGPVYAAGDDGLVAEVAA